MSLFTLPDRQVVYLLEYLRDGLNGHKYVDQWFDTSDVVVDSTFAYDPKKPVVYKDEWMWKLQAAQFPCLGIWRIKNNPDRNRTFTEVDAECGIGWFAHVPSGDAEHEPDSWGRTFASNIWFVCLELLENTPVSVKQKGGFTEVWMGPGDVAVDAEDSLCGFIAPLTIHHIEPPYSIDDLDALAQVAVDIKLYDSATVDPADQKQGLYDGLTTETEVDPQT